MGPGWFAGVHTEVSKVLPGKTSTERRSEDRKGLALQVAMSMNWCPSQRPPEAIIGNAPVSMDWLGYMLPMGPQAVLGGEGGFAFFLGRRLHMVECDSRQNSVSLGDAVGQASQGG